MLLLAAEVFLLVAFLFGMGITFLKPALKDWGHPVIIIVIGLVFAALIFTATAQEMIQASLASGAPINTVGLSLSGALQSLLGAVLYIAGLGFAEILGGGKKED